MEKHGTKTPYFTVIVPVYNGECFIERCIQELLKQTYQNFELIIINDGSTDQTGSLIKSLYQQTQIRKENGNEMSARIKYISLPYNRGVAEARNRAMESATGRYTLFVDADDQVDKTLLEKIHDCIEASGIADLKLVVFGIRECYYASNGKILKEKNIVPQEMIAKTKGDARKALIKLEEQTLYGYLWNKAYLTSYWKEQGFQIPDMKILEDIFFNMLYCQNIDSLAVIAENLYVYEKRWDSATAKPIPDYYEIHRERMRRLYEQYKSWNMLQVNTLSQLSGSYTRYVYSAIIRKPRNQRKSFVQQLYQDPVYEKFMMQQFGNGGNKPLKWMQYFLKKKNTGCVLMIANTIEWVQHSLHKTYLLLK